MKLGALGFRTTLVVLLTALALTVAGAQSKAASGPTWGHARIAERGSDSIFEVDGKPFFLFGAAFFYERLPRDRWELSMSRLRGMGINTLDLYVPWNWHELSDGDFDFDGRTSPRRDFAEVLRLAKRFDFKIVLRPGPVVRNEWRNGGYPAWLLERPEYGMPLHDLLEGRYPPTATLQNQHSDDAAAEWMRNAAHMKYAQRWLERVMREAAPYADRILAVALDDDQGAYIDNQTYPAPHLQAYLQWLRDIVHGVTGPLELTFINTYQMKVPASSPVWAMGNWYQSDAYAIGTHDEAQLAFSMAQLGTRPHQPLFASEFQAGWLQGAGEAYPRPADPSNTQLAIATMIGTGVRGLVNFPAQDTLDPTGWEAPFANFAYAWDAALRLDDTSAARYAPTAEVGALVRSFGTELAASVARYDARIVYAGSSVAASGANGTTFSTIASATIDAQQSCRAAGYACNLVDVGTLADSDVARNALFIVPAYDAVTRREIGPALNRRLAELVRRRKAIVRYVRATDDPKAMFSGRTPIVGHVDDAVFSEVASRNLSGFLSVTNYSQTDRFFALATVTTSNGTRIALPPFTVRAHSALIAPIGARVAKSNPLPADSLATPTSEPITLRPDFALPALPEADEATRRHGESRVTSTDIFREGFDSVMLRNGDTEIVISPLAGARSFLFSGSSDPHRNWFTTVGGLRDDVALEPPLSTTDRIAKYTHDFPAGTFNRPYAVAATDVDSARFTYTAPDVMPHGAAFDRTIRLASNGSGIDMDESVDFPEAATMLEQRGISVSSFAIDPKRFQQTRLFAPTNSQLVVGSTAVVSRGNSFAIVRDPADVMVVSWHAGDIERAELRERSDSVIVRLTIAPGRRAHVIFRITSPLAGSIEKRIAQVEAEAQNAAQVTPSPARTP